MNIDPNADYTGYRPMKCAHPGCGKTSIKYLVPADSVDYCDAHDPIGVRLRAVKDAADDRDPAILAADEAGWKRRAIATELGISPTTVYDVLRKAGRIHD